VKLYQIFIISNFQLLLSVNQVLFVQRSISLEVAPSPEFSDTGQQSNKFLYFVKRSISLEVAPAPECPDTVPWSNKFLYFVPRSISLEVAPSPEFHSLS
jgi:hypothetical protein